MLRKAGKEMIKAILFDCDGTLVDSETLSACATDYAFNRILKRPLTDKESKSLLGRPANKILEEWFQETGKEIFEEATNHFIETIDDVKPYEGIEDMLRFLSKKHRLAIVSSSSKEIVMRMLISTRLSQYFEFIVGHEDTDKHKPNPEPILEAMKRLNVRNSECVYIGDQPYDIMAARDAEVKVFGATWGSGNRDILESYDPYVILANPKELERFEFDKI